MYSNFLNASLLNRYGEVRDVKLNFGTTVTNNDGSTTQSFSLSPKGEEGDTLLLSVKDAITCEGHYNFMEHHVDLRYMKEAGKRAFYVMLDAYCPVSLAESDHSGFEFAAITPDGLALIVRDTTDSDCEIQGELRWKCLD